MASPRKKNPLALKVSAEVMQDITHRLVEEIRTGKAARSLAMEDNGLIDYAYSLYEQRSGQPISQQNPQTYGAPDLTSPIGTEIVDTLSARASQTLFRLEPLWIVEGIGEESAKKAPVCEAFMQVRQEEMRLQKVSKRAITAAFVETGSVLEVCEDVEREIKHDKVKAKIQTSPVDGTFILDGDTAKPVPELDEDGCPVPVESDEEPFVEVTHTYEDYRRRGAYARRVSMKDFMFLPNHASDEREVWAHATRFFLAAEEIQRRVDNGSFRKEVLEKIGLDSMERQQSAEADRTGVTVDFTPGTGTAEHEWWSVQLWADLDGKGLSCYRAIVSERHGVIASIEYDWLRRWRTIYLNPMPCPYSVYGYSAIFTKLGSTIEEHTAWRNMNAFRATLKSHAPMKRRRGSSWDPRIQPMGADQVIDVDDMHEIEPFEIEDVSQQALSKEQQCVSDGQRVIGINDVAIGQLSSERRTLGENELATRQSFMRTDDPLGNLQESFEELGEVIHAIEVEALKEMKERPAPSSATSALQYQSDSTFNGTFTYETVSGTYRFKPRGSSDAADPNQIKKQFNELVGNVNNLAKVNPGIARRMQSDEFGDALMQMLVEAYKPRDRKPFIQPMQPPQPMAPAGMPMPGAPPLGLPPGAHPGAPQFGGQQVIDQALAGAGGPQ